MLLDTNTVLLLLLQQSRSEREAAQKSEWLRLWRKKNRAVKKSNKVFILLQRKGSL